MNEPNAAVLVIFLALIGAVLLVPATAITWLVLRLDPAAWNRFSKAVFVVALLAVISVFLIRQSPEAELYRSAIIALGVSTAAATWIAGRTRYHGGATSFWRILRATSLTQFAVGFAIITTNC